MNLLTAAGFGFFGGIVRALVGLMKVKNIKKKFNLMYFLVTVAASGLIGTFTGMLVGADYRLSLLAGYAGIDIIEGVYKIRKVRT